MPPCALPDTQPEAASSARLYRSSGRFCPCVALSVVWCRRGACDVPPVSSYLRPALVQSHARASCLHPPLSQLSPFHCPSFSCFFYILPFFPYFSLLIIPFFGNLFLFHFTLLFTHLFLYLLLPRFTLRPFLLSNTSPPASSFILSTITRLVPHVQRVLRRVLGRCGSRRGRVIWP